MGAINRKDTKLHGQIAQAELQRLSGSLALPNSLEIEALKSISKFKGYTSGELFQILLNIAKKRDFQINKEYLNATLLNFYGLSEIDYNKIKKNICPECNSSNNFLNKKHKEFICKNCGLVLNFLFKKE